ncbi:MAG: serine/threonine protein kinase [Verrucomicrobia bacterium]|jgi:serine/threonine protein kinase|nr:serine/threonine protein kinase [Verrucomicrobiota bacterium]
MDRSAREWVSARASFLEPACGGDIALSRRLDALLAAHEPPETLLATQADATPPAPDPDESPEPAVSQTLGRYKLLEKIGEGGCGVVYLAEQTEPVWRRVALKVIKLGMDTHQVVARFEAERQALAMMDHPSLAKVLDAGIVGEDAPRSADSPAGAPRNADFPVGKSAAKGEPPRAGWKTGVTGRPYFVMERVRGIKITDYCDQEKLGTRDRLELFIKVCHAIQHAHQKGIIHRDIKPSNILVTPHDGVPVPKVIDFGIAKATEGRLTDATVYTQLHQFIGTLAYMSPEQAAMSGLDMNTRRDIYSLGLLPVSHQVAFTELDEEAQRNRVEGERTLHFLDPATRDIVGSLPLLAPGERSSTSIAHRRFSPDGTRLAAANHDGRRVDLDDVASGRRLYALPDEIGVIWWLARHTPAGNQAHQEPWTAPVAKPVRGWAP